MDTSVAAHEGKVADHNLHSAIHLHGVMLNYGDNVPFTFRPTFAPFVTVQRPTQSPVVLGNEGHTFPTTALNIMVIVNYKLKSIHGNGLWSILRYYPNSSWYERGFPGFGRNFEAAVSRIQSNSCNRYTPMFGKFEQTK